LENTSGPEYGFCLANQSDAAEIADLVNSAYRGESSKAGWTTEEALLGGQRTDAEMISQMIAKPDQQIWLLRDMGQGDIAACAHLEKIGERCFLGMLTVKPELQKDGLGRMVIEHCEDVAYDDFGCSEMVMTVISVREELIAYYERRGYQKTGESKAFPRDNPRFGLPKREDFNLILMAKPLQEYQD
jgi:ribosomal protein S18 acetylase RimI-like enzyme